MQINCGAITLEIVKQDIYEKFNFAQLLHTLPLQYSSKSLNVICKLTWLACQLLNRIDIVYVYHIFS